MLVGSFAVLVVVGLLVGRGPSAKPLPGPPLRDAGPLRVGTAVDATALDREAGYREVLRGFSSLTAENAMKWDALEPERGSLQWDAADGLVDAAADQRADVRGHTLVWHAQQPGWVGALRGEELRAALRGHVSRTMERYRGRVARWDVLNEVVGDDGRLRRSNYLRELGPSYLTDALRWAQRADPDAERWINEIGAEGDGPKADGLVRTVGRLKAAGAPLDGVGLQGHFNLDGVPAGFARTLRRLAALDVRVAITELDVALPAEPSRRDLDAQARIFAEVVRTCRAVPACEEVTLWGFTDAHSWIPDTQPGFGAATPLDEELRPKPAYRALVDALR